MPPTPAAVHLTTYFMSHDRNQHQWLGSTGTVNQSAALPALQGCKNPSPRLCHNIAPPPDPRPAPYEGTMQPNQRIGCRYTRGKRHAGLCCRSRRRREQPPGLVAGIGRSLGGGSDPHPGQGRSNSRGGGRGGDCRRVESSCCPESGGRRQAGCHRASNDVPLGRERLPQVRPILALTNRLRTEGLDNLLAAAKEAQTPRVVAQSFCG